MQLLQTLIKDLNADNASQLTPRIQALIQAQRQILAQQYVELDSRNATLWQQRERHLARTKTIT